MYNMYNWDFNDNHPLSMIIGIMIVIIYNQNNRDYLSSSNDQYSLLSNDS
jgi:hypothetical protein